MILAGRDEARLGSRAEQLAGGSNLVVLTEAFDATDFASHPDFVERVFSGQEDIDLVVLAFGVLGNQTSDEHDPAAAIRAAQTNYVGAMSVLIPVAERLRAQGHGEIVVLSTVAAERPRRSNFIYGSSKAGLDWFAQGLGDALQGSGVRVMVVRPGFVRSKMTSALEEAPLACTPDDVAVAILAGLAKGHEMVWVPAKLRWLMSILRHLPRPVFRKLNL
jgi:decaprenylphospho-beta-D-erythro-pentofuranosid-2-ulose 2-reductase